MPEHEHGTIAPKGINLVIENGVYPTGRVILENSRRTLAIAKENGVANVPFLRYALGQFGDNGLHYLRTDPIGSCVVLTLWNPSYQVGAVSHFAVTNNALRGSSDVLGRLKTLGLEPGDFEARLIGGGFEQNERYLERYLAMSQNLVRGIWSSLQENNVPLVETDLYGRDIRCIVLYLKNGEVFNYPYDVKSVTKNDVPIETMSLPFNSLPPNEHPST